MRKEAENELNMVAPIGAIVAWPGPLNTIPNKWKLCNGEYLLASKYPILLSVVQDYWGNYRGADATQAFKLPDLRGVFVRGVNEERNDEYHDPDKNNRKSSKGVSNEVGSYQQDSLQMHIHQVGRSTSDKKADSQHSRTRFADFYHVDDKNAHKTSGPTSITNIGGVPKVSPETRAKNAYINYIIKAE